MNLPLVIALRWTLQPIVSLVAWCMWVEGGVGE